MFEIIDFALQLFQIINIKLYIFIRPIKNTPKKQNNKTFFANKDQNIFQLRSQILNSGINLRQV